MTDPLRYKWLLHGKSILVLFFGFSDLKLGAGFKKKYHLYLSRFEKCFFFNHGRVIKMIKMEQLSNLILKKGLLKTRASDEAKTVGDMKPLT